MNRILRNALAVAALAITTPALAVWPDIDFAWYANVGKTLRPPASETMPAPREGYIFSPAHWERRGDTQVFVARHWIKDDFCEQLAQHDAPLTVACATAPLARLDN